MAISKPLLNLINKINTIDRYAIARWKIKEFNVDNKKNELSFIVNTGSEKIKIIIKYIKNKNCYDIYLEKCTCTVIKEIVDSTKNVFNDDIVDVIDGMIFDFSYSKILV